MSSPRIIRRHRRLWLCLFPVRATKTLPTAPRLLGLRWRRRTGINDLGLGAARG